MKLSAKSRQKLENFFREYFQDEYLKLPPIEIHIGFWANFITRRLKIHGITLGRHIFLLPEIIKCDDDNCKFAPEGLVVHEATHVLQYRKQGFLGFLIRYVWSYWKNLRTKKSWDLESRWDAYKDISHEIEARAAADAYLSNGEW